MEVETDNYRCTDCEGYLRRTQQRGLWICQAHPHPIYFRIGSNDDVVDFRLSRAGRDR